MAITQFPSDLIPKEQVGCVICGASIYLCRATVGPLDADCQQAFACNAHFWEGNRYILGWVDFLAKERLKLLTRGSDPNDLMGGGCGAWAV